MIRPILLVTAIALSISACNQMSAPAPESEADAVTTPVTEEEKTLYALGRQVAMSLSQFELSEEELALVQSGIEDGVTGKESDIDPGEYLNQVRTLGQSRLQAAADRSKEASGAYLAELAAQPGAQKFDSGLVMFELVAGDGPQPAATDTVNVHYHGTLTDGTVFDSSVDRGEPISFPLNGVIPCWTEGVQKIKVGGKARLVCPSDIAYGDRGRPPKIPPAATLVFEVELLGIE